jgi:hypothetical protein
MTSPGGHRRPDPIFYGGGWTTLALGDLAAVPREVQEAIRESEQDRYPV